MLGNYFFIDGSALAAQIRRLRRADGAFASKKLDPRLFIQHFVDNLADLGAHQYKRATFYFPKGDEVTAGEYLLLPDFKRPGHVRDMHFKFCGQKLKGSTEFNKFVEETVPAKFRDRVSKSEKGIDIEICCDALKLASASRMERLFLLTNDDDFLPLCRTLKEFGANVSLIHLSDVVSPNESLLTETDSYDVIPRAELLSMFVEGSPVEPTTSPDPVPADVPEDAETPAAAANPEQDEEPQEVLSSLETTTVVALIKED